MMKVPEDLRTQSTTGGAISLLSLSLILMLFLSEFVSFLTPIRTTSLSVDTGRDELFSVHLEMDMPYINCDVIGVDALDAGGTIRLEIENELFKIPIDHYGNVVKPSDPPARLVRQHMSNATDTTHANAISKTPNRDAPTGCDSCFGAEDSPTDCCNTCDSVRTAYEKRGWLIHDLSRFPQCRREGKLSLTRGEFDEKHGCKIKGNLKISKVAGRIHITPGHSFSFAGHVVHDYSALRNKKFDLSHHIHKLNFGTEFPGQTNALDRTKRMAKRGETLVGQHEYFIRVVPTTYKYAFSRTVYTNQYSQTYFFRRSDPQKGGTHIPGIFLNYDLSPIHVEVNESRPSFFHFLVQLCAIIGGVFTVASMLSTFMDDVVLKAMKKRQVGKHI